MFEFLTNYTLVVYGNYIRIGGNVTPNQKLHCNYYTTLTHIIMPGVCISTAH
jgi:hypothetical protein